MGGSWGGAWASWVVLGVLKEEDRTPGGTGDAGIESLESKIGVLALLFFY